MDINEKLEFWNSEIERAREYDFYFDPSSVAEIVEECEKQQQEIERMNIAISEMERAKALIEENLKDGNTHEFDDLPSWKQSLVSEASLYHKYLHILKENK